MNLECSNSVLSVNSIETKHPMLGPRIREVAGSNPGRDIPNTLHMLVSLNLFILHRLQNRAFSVYQFRRL